MTVTFSDGFTRLLFKWRGSVWKMIWRKLILWLLAYYAINLSYRFLMNSEQQTHFEKVVVYCGGKTSYIPLSLLLGFFVKEVFSRWYAQFRAIHYPDTICIKMLPYMEGMDERKLTIRRTIARWVVLTLVLCWRRVSVNLRRRFPTLKHLVKAGLLDKEELNLLLAVPDDHGIWFVPLAWTLNFVRYLEINENLSKYGVREVMNECDKIRTSCTTLLNYDWLTVPIPYVQVATIATYGYFTICLLARQLLDESKAIKGYELDHYFPVFTVLQFLFYMGWLEVGQDLMRPFGDDDDDFEFNYLVDRHLHVSLLWADQLGGQLPGVGRDSFWGQRRPLMPYTEQSLLKPDYRPGINIPKDKLGDIWLDAEFINDREQIEKRLTANENEGCFGQMLGGGRGNGRREGEGDTLFRATASTKLPQSPADNDDMLKKM